ncbi:hypothetical protein MMC12_000402 [Toensbergia leucococca]|nr:hypothetical protein [Toensbergia leucococca]
MPPFKLLPAHPPDHPQIAFIYDLAFRSDRIIGELMRDVPPSCKQQSDVEWLDREWEHRALNGTRIFKIVDDEDEKGKILAFSKWQYPPPHPLTLEQAAQKKFQKEQERAVSLPAGTNEGLWEDYFGRVEEMNGKWMDEGRDYYLQILAVHPTHQRQGHGSTLIRHTLSAADADDAKTYVGSSSAAGLGLYFKHGWREVDMVVVEMGEFGGVGVVEERFLLRESGRGGDGADAA